MVVLGGGGAVSDERGTPVQSVLAYSLLPLNCQRGHFFATKGTSQKATVVTKLDLFPRLIAEVVSGLICPTVGP